MNAPSERVAFSIGEAAKAAGLPVKTLRYYEQIGMIPRVRRANGGARNGGHRLYTAVDVGRLRFIRHARLLGLPLSDVRELVALADGKGCPSSQPEYHAILQRHLRAIDERINHLLGLRSSIRLLISPARQTKAEKCSWETCACMDGRANRAPARG